MDDLISRRAAIRALTEAYEDIDAEWILERLPSAQPDIIRCKDCKHYEGGWYCSAWNNSPGFPIVTEKGYCNLAERRTDG